MRQGTSENRAWARKPIAVLSAFLMIAAAMVALAQPTSSETVTTKKTVPIVCKGADAASSKLLDIIGGSIKATVDVDVVLPTKLSPGETGAKASFTWTTKLSADLANTAVGLGVKEVTMSNMAMDVAVSGETSLKSIPGRPGTRKIALQANTPIATSAGPFTGDITDVGNSGFVRFRSTKIDMTVALSLAGVSQALNITCAAPATLGTVSIRVAGSPNVKNFTEIVTKPGTKTFDILGTATNGVDKNGTERAIEPESLKVVSGTGTVNADGTISVAAPAPGQTSEVVYELCAGEVVVTPAQDGVDEVQVITFDRASASSQDFKRTAAFTLGFGEESSDPIWSVRNTLTGNMVTGPAPRNWQNRANDYILFHEFRFPSADAVKAALEGIPGIGAGNVEVVELPREINRINRYKVTFVGALKQKDVPELEVTNHYSLPPQELLADLLELAGELTGGEEPGGSTTTTTIPGGLSLTEYYEELNKDAQRALNRGDFAGYLELTGQALQLIADNPTAFIDIQAAIAAIGELFPPGPVLSTETPGEPETAAEVQQLCSQGVISLSTTATSAEDAAAAAAAPPAGAAGAPAANAATGAPIKITG